MPLISIYSRIYWKLGGYVSNCCPVAAGCASFYALYLYFDSLSNGPDKALLFFRMLLPHPKSGSFLKKDNLVGQI